jgi:hypothetical protein
MEAVKKAVWNAVVMEAVRKAVMEALSALHRTFPGKIRGVHSLEPFRGGGVGEYTPPNLSREDPGSAFPRILPGRIRGVHSSEPFRGGSGECSPQNLSGEVCSSFPRVSAVLGANLPFFPVLN